MIMFNLDKRKTFSTLGRSSIQLIAYEINEWTDGGFQLVRSEFIDGKIEGGNSFSLGGVIKDYFVDAKEVKKPGYRMRVSVDTDCSRFQMESGILGGGQLYADYVHVDLNLEPQQVHNALGELRCNAARSVRIDGYLINNIIFRVKRFRLSSPNLSKTLLPSE